jgi:hypothetical protein
MLARLGNWIAGLRKGGRREVGLTEDGFVSAGKLIGWGDVATVVALRHDIYLGEVVCLAVASKDGTTCSVAEGDPLWRASLDAITKHLPSALPLEDWFLDVASGKRDVVIVYGRQCGNEARIKGKAC